MRGKKGFTIVEMLVVIAVLGVLVGIISTAAGSAIRQARVKRMSAMRTILQTGLATYYAQKGVWPGKLKTLSDQGTGGKKRRVEYLNETEADTVFKEVVAESRKGNPMMDISGLFVCDNPDSDTSRSKRHGTDLRSLIAAKKNIANVAYGYATKEEGVFRRFIIKYNYDTDTVTVMTQNEGDSSDDYVRETGRQWPDRPDL